MKAMAAPEANKDRGRGLQALASLPSSVMLRYGFAKPGFGTADLTFPGESRHKAAPYGHSSRLLWRSFGLQLCGLGRIGRRASRRGPRCPGQFQTGRVGSRMQNTDWP